MSIFVFFHSTHDLHQTKKSVAPPPGYSGYVCEICWNLNYYVISCARVDSCRPGAFTFLWGGFGSCWPEAIPRCRSPPPSFRSLVNQQPKRRSIWLLSICGTITHSIHRIASWKYRKKLQKCSKSLIVKRLLIGCVHTATKPTIPLIGMTGSVFVALSPHELYERKVTM